MEAHLATCSVHYGKSPPSQQRRYNDDDVYDDDDFYDDVYNDDKGPNGFSI